MAGCFEFDAEENECSGVEDKVFYPVAGSMVVIIREDDDCTARVTNK